jgi:hypothetical protein
MDFRLDERLRGCGLCLRSSYARGPPSLEAGHTNALREDLGPKRRLNLLFADTKFLDDVFVALSVVLLQIVEQAATLADHHEQTAPGSVVFLVRFEVLRQLPDPFTQDCNLHFRTSGV